MPLKLDEPQLPAPLPRVSSTAVGVPRQVRRGMVVAESEDSDSESNPRDLLLGDTAKGYYLSLLLHVVAYVAAAILFVLFSDRFLDQDNLGVSIRASLDDRDILDDAPPFEVVPDISLGPAQGPGTIQQLSNNLSIVENGLIESLSTDKLLSLASAQKDDEATSGGEAMFFKLPESGLAVTKGSFTAWTMPEKPAPNESYMIVIEVRLPDNVKAYRLNDLSGTVRGTDGYAQKIPYDQAHSYSSYYTDENNELKNVTGSESVKVRNNKIQLGIRIPGAARLVQDTIQIKSRRLRERQELELIFGGG